MDQKGLVVKRIIIGSDHRGFDLKQALINNYTEFQWTDVGTESSQSVDYPIFAKKACEQILSGQAEFGILICGSGIGMSVAANRFNGIYAGLCWNEKIATMARQDDGINVLVLPADFVSESEAFSIFEAWANAKFKEGQYRQRLLMIDEKE